MIQPAFLTIVFISATEQTYGLFISGCSGKGPVQLNTGVGVISVTFTFVNQFGVNLGFRI